MILNENYKQNEQEVLNNSYVKGERNCHSDSSPQPSIDPALSPPSQLNNSLNIEHIGERLHFHTCVGCGNDFLCEYRHCVPPDEQACEQCVIAANWMERWTNRKRFEDCQDDQANMQEMEWEAMKERYGSRVQSNEYYTAPWGTDFSGDPYGGDVPDCWWVTVGPEAAKRSWKDANRKRRRWKERPRHKVGVQRTLTRKEENA
jgi:hypothetical protein